jgi:NNP family putative nitrate transporter
MYFYTFFMSHQSGKYQWLILGVAVYSFIVMMMNFSVFPIVSDEMSKEISLTYSQIGLLMAIFSFLYAVVQIPTGIASDRFGGSKIASLSVLILGFSGLLLAFTPSYSVALLARILIGLSAGFLIPSTVRLLPGWFKAKDYDRAMGIYGTGQGAALFITLLSIPPVVSIYGWRKSLILVSFLTLIAAALSLTFLRDKENTDNKSGQLNFKNFKNVINTQLLLLTSVNVTAMSFFTGILTWMPLFLIKKLEFSLNEVGYTSAVMGAMMVLSSYVGGSLSNRISGSKIILITMVICVISPVMFIYSDSSLSVFFISILFGWAIMLSFGPIFGAIPKVVKKEFVGMGFGIFNTITFIGSSITPAITGYILDVTRNFSFVFLAISLISLIGLAGSLKLLHMEKIVNLNIQ